MASALAKLATGSVVLRNELNLDAVLQQVGWGGMCVCLWISGTVCARVDEWWLEGNGIRAPFSASW